MNNLQRHRQIKVADYKCTKINHCTATITGFFVPNIVSVTKGRRNRRSAALPGQVLARQMPAEKVLLQFSNKEIAQMTSPDEDEEELVIPRQPTVVKSAILDIAVSVCNSHKKKHLDEVSTIYSRMHN